MSTSSQKTGVSQLNHIDQLQDAFLPRFYECEMPTSFRTPVTATTTNFDDELDDGDFEYEATLMKSFNQEQQQDKAVHRLRQILGQLNPLYSTTPLSAALNDLSSSSI